MSNVKTKTTKTKVSNVVETTPTISDEMKAQIIEQYEKERIISEKESALIIANFKEKQKKTREANKLNETQLSKDRKELNNNVRVELLTFDAVFETTIKQKFNILTSRPTLQKLAQNIDLVSSLLYKTASQKFIDEVGNKNVHWNRFSRLITDKKLLHSFGTTTQKKDSKCWTATSCMDLLLKALTATNQTYENSLIVRKQK
jgi:hypothetical protein